MNRDDGAGSETGDGQPSGKRTTLSLRGEILQRG